ncbi:MAG: LPS assembly protein LptD [Rhodobacteraceae bacterium]|nr:LPS assembly protein LptD [Paracoccaceae bacterium]
MTRRLLAFLFFLLVAAPLSAQEAATLIADRVEAHGDLLTATGNIEIFQGTTRLRAQRIIYDGATDTLTIDGPIELRDGQQITILASQAELSRGLADGILRGARLVLNQQLQIAAVEMQRVAGRYTTASRVGATSCHVCENGRPPLWQIRASRITHDAEEKQLYFDRAQLQVLGVPIFYVPRLRLPDPGNARSTGLLIPEIKSSTLLGNGVKLPYFIAFGDDADLTVTPFITTDTRTLELRYRQAYERGWIDLNAYLSDDRIDAPDFRWGILARGAFGIAHGYTLAFDVEEEGDLGYLNDYDYSGKDRLDSAISLSRTRAQDDTFAELVSIRSLRDGEDNDEFPALLFEARHTERIGQTAALTFDMDGHFRRSDLTTDADGDGLADGLDSLRFGAAGDWNWSTLLSRGLIFEAKAQAGADIFLFSDDPSFDDTVTLGHGAAAVGLRWPLIQRGSGPGAATNMIEPHVQLVYGDAPDVALPNEDSTRVEFDEGNLFALNRAPGSDFFERGFRLDAGVTWRRQGPTGWDSTLTIGRVERFSGNNTAFTAASGLSGGSSNWLVSGALATGERLDLTGRMIFDNDFSVSKGDLRVAYDADRLRIDTSYAYLERDLEEDRTSTASELALTTAYDFSNVLTGRLDMRYDFTTEKTTEAGVGITYVNECVEVGFSVSRTFTASASVTPSTEYGLTVRLRGFGAEAVPQARKATCS